MKPKTIRGLKTKNRFFLAPMEEVNDIAFRLLCKKAGAGLTFTGMTSPLNRKDISLDDKPALQLFGTSAEGIAQFIKKYNSKVSMWDFNLGCPAKNARKKGHGAYLTDLVAIEKIIQAMHKATKKPISIKIRKSPISFQLLEFANKYCDAITVHPRTNAQGYSGKAEITFAEKIKASAKIPMIYSGDVDEHNAHQLLKKFDYIMIGRKAIGNPNIFRKLQNKKPNTTFLYYLKLAEKYNLYFRFIKFQAMCFTKGHKAAKQLRLNLFKAKSIEDIKEVYKNEKEQGDN